jgi:hypothetical protein
VASAIAIVGAGGYATVIAAECCTLARHRPPPGSAAAYRDMRAVTIHDAALPAWRRDTPLLISSDRSPRTKVCDRIPKRNERASPTDHSLISKTDARPSISNRPPAERENS